MPGKRINKSKKNNNHFSGQQKKQYYAQAANFYYKRLKVFAVSCGLHEILVNLPKDLKKLLLSASIDHFVVETPDKEHPGSDSIKDILDYLDNELKSVTLPILTDQEPVSLHDFFTLGFTLYLFFNHTVGSSLLLPGDIRQKIEALTDLSKRGGVDERLGRIYFILTLFISTFDKGYYLPGISIRQRDSGFPRFYVNFKLDYLQSEVINLDIIGKKRPVYRVGWPFNAGKMVWANIKLSDNSKKVLPVYIQAHALIRLDERLDSILSRPYRHFSLFLSLNQAEVKPGNVNSFLIDYIFMNKKVGYLVCDRIDDIFLVRTFLFITQDGTPEGQNLRRLAGISKTDNQYWALDKLSTFLADDFIENKQIISLLMEAGCSDLVEFDYSVLADLNNKHSISDFALHLEKTIQFSSGFEFNLL